MRHYYKRILTFCTLIFIVIGCQSSLTNADGDTEFAKLASEGEKVSFNDVTLTKGISGNTGLDEQSYAIRSRAELEDVWQKLYAHVDTAPDLPEVNFNSRMVIGLHSDTKSSGGYAVKITDIVRANGELAVRVDQTAPGSDCSTTTALGTPYHFITVPKADASVAFYKYENQQDC